MEHPFSLTARSDLLLFFHPGLRKLARGYPRFSPSGWLVEPTIGMLKRQDRRKTPKTGMFAALSNFVRPRLMLPFGKMAEGQNRGPENNVVRISSGFVPRYC